MQRFGILLEAFLPMYKFELVTQRWSSNPLGVAKSIVGIPIITSGAVSLMRVIKIK